MKTHGFQKRFSRTAWILIFLSLLFSAGCATRRVPDPKHEENLSMLVLCEGKSADQMNRLCVEIILDELKDIPDLKRVLKSTTDGRAEMTLIYRTLRPNGEIRSRVKQRLGNIRRRLPNGSVLIEKKEETR